MSACLPSDDDPLVTIGVPVRNGAPTLARALDSLVGQTYRRLEIIISDNASSDATEAICREYAARDARVRYIRHACALGVIENFRAPVEAARGEFFMWAAYDDVRDDNYVEVLQSGLRSNAGATLVFSNTAEFVALHAPQDAQLVGHRFDTTGLTFLDRVRQHTTNACVHIYGLMRASVVREYPWFQSDEGWDVPFLMWLATRGAFIFVPGTTFYYYRPASRSLEERALENNYRPPTRWWPEQLAWACACAVADASARDRRPTNRFYAMPVMYFHILQGARGIVARFTPEPIRQVYRVLRQWRRRAITREDRAA